MLGQGAQGTKRVSTKGDAAIRVTLRGQSHGTKIAIVAYIDFKNEAGSHWDGGLHYHSRAYGRVLPHKPDQVPVM